VCKSVSVCLCLCACVSVSVRVCVRACVSPSCLMYDGAVKREQRGAGKGEQGCTEERGEGGEEETPLVAPSS
jgi:hypothetical protein